MKNIATKTLLLLAAALTIASTADAQIIKRNKPKKLSVKAQLAIERQRTDSLSSLVEEYRQRESDWQRAWHDENEARKAKPVSSDFNKEVAHRHVVRIADVQNNVAVEVATTHSLTYRILIDTKFFGRLLIRNIVAAQKLTKPLPAINQLALLLCHNRFIGYYCLQYQF